MEKVFWQDKWDKNELGFHRGSVNPLLEQNIQHLALNSSARIFIPLCGKTLDISWLLSKGYAVVGAEMVEIAVMQLFNELGVTPQITHLGKLKRYSAEKLDIFVGDIFDLSKQEIGKVDAIYDRAALVALPVELRKQYSAHLIHITQHAPQLLISFVYEQAMMSGPPFSVDDEEVHSHYAGFYTLKQTNSAKVTEPVKGHDQILENVWILESNT